MFYWYLHIVDRKEEKMDEEGVPHHEPSQSCPLLMILLLSQFWQSMILDNKQNRNMESGILEHWMHRRGQNKELVDSWVYAHITW